MCFRGSAFMLAVALAAAGSLSGQEIPTGTWTGSVTEPGGGIAEVTYSVTEQDGALEILLHPPEEANMGPIPLEDLRLEGGSLFFTWSPRTTLVCELERMDDGSFDGVCEDPEGDVGFMEMIPPEV